MSRNSRLELKKRTRPLAWATIFLGAGLITAALVIGFISYQYSYRMMEQGYQNFYLNKAQMIVNASRPQQVESDQKLIQSLEKAWESAGHRPADEYICVVDKKGNLLLHTAAPQTVGNYAGDNRVFEQNQAHPGRLCELVATKRDYVGQYVSSSGDDQIAAFVSIPGREWMLGVHRSRGALSGQIEDGFRPLILGFILVVGMLMPLTLFMAYRVYSRAQQRQLAVEMALHDSEARYQSLVETMPQCLYRADLQGRVTYANRALLEMLELEESKCLGCTVEDIFPPEIAANQMASDIELLRSGGTMDLVEEHRPGQGRQTRYIQVVKHPVRDAEGRYVGVQGIFWDVTDKIQAEKKLEHTKAQLQAILNSVPSGILATDSQGFLTQVNQKATEIMGLSAEESLGEPISKVIPQTGLIKTLRSRRAELGKPFSWGNKKLIVSRSPIFDEQAEVIGAVSVFSDQSELEMVQRQLEEMKQLNDEFSSLVDNSHDGVLITDNRKIIRVNPSFSRITSLAPSIVEGKDVAELDLSEHICMAAVKEVFHYVLERGSSLTLRRKLRSQNEIFVTGTPVFDREGRVARVVMNIRDVTELESLEEQIKRLSAAYMDNANSCQASLVPGFVAESPEIKKVLDLVMRISRVDSTVLLMGESGVGKDMLASMIHRLSKRHDQPFIAVNCGAIPEHLLESELFGYEKGAFSGADKAGKPGLFEEANGGTIFLDEVAELPLALQVKLLKVLQEQQCRRLGSVKTLNLDVRIVAATNRDLKAMVADGLFREDLFYRLYVVPIEVPPLRERREDILPLALHELKACNQKYGVTKTLGQELLGVLERYDWPGNVRELHNLVERMVVTADTEVLQPRHLPESLQPAEREARPSFNLPEGLSLREARDLLERQMILEALANTTNLRDAAKILGVDHSTVARKARKWGLQPGGETNGSSLH